MNKKLTTSMASAVSVAALTLLTSCGGGGSSGGGGSVYAGDAGMGVRAAQNRRVGQPQQRNVVSVGGAASNKTRVLAAANA